jgi:phosphoenolpyruvate synthase/pyruvate phosphate dikinase
MTSIRRARLDQGQSWSALTREIAGDKGARRPALADANDVRDEAVRWMIRHVIWEAGKSGTKVCLRGQAPSDHPEFAAFLVESGIDAMAETPDSFMAVKQAVALAEGWEG